MRIERDGERWRVSEFVTFIQRNTPLLIFFPRVFTQRKSILNPEAKEFIPGKKY